MIFQIYFLSYENQYPGLFFLRALSFLKGKFPGNKLEPFLEDRACDISKQSAGKVSGNIPLRISRQNNFGDLNLECDWKLWENSEKTIFCSKGVD